MKYIKTELTCWPNDGDEPTRARTSYHSWENTAVSTAVLDEVQDKLTDLVTPVVHEVAMNIHWDLSRKRKRLQPKGIRVKPFSSQKVIYEAR